MSCSLKSVLAEVQRTTVSVNGVVIPHDAVAREVQHHPEVHPGTRLAAGRPRACRPRAPAAGGAPPRPEGPTSDRR